jgi:hypothetical protein
MGVAVSLPEETGKVASNAIDAMRGSPGLLSVIILQVTTLIVLYFISSANRDREQAREIALIERCWPQTHKEDRL